MCRPQRFGTLNSHDLSEVMIPSRQIAHDFAEVMVCERLKLCLPFPWESGGHNEKRLQRARVQALVLPAAAGASRPCRGGQTGAGRVPVAAPQVSSSRQVLLAFQRVGKCRAHHEPRRCRYTFTCEEPLICEEPVDGLVESVAICALDTLMPPRFSIQIRSGALASGTAWNGFECSDQRSPTGSIQRLATLMFLSPFSASGRICSATTST